ncbi:MAG: hypothetical protein HYV51_00300 [Parcubacteria group bacterium]|nr:hypothetical protein [Parcubacteria group bacterium]
MTKDSREDYGAAVWNKEQSELEVKQNPRSFLEELSDRDSWAQRRLQKAKAKLEKIKSLNYDKALELEGKHKQLVQAVADAQKTLFEFERTELDMHKVEDGDETVE